LRGRSDRLEVLDAIKAADLKVLRLFISETFKNFKNTGSVYMPDIEPKQVGQFDDTQLAAIDQLMVEAHERGKIGIFRQSESDAKMPTW
jgi:mannan endo-1,4-beta-mannosidase